MRLFKKDKRFIQECTRNALNCGNRGNIFYFVVFSFYFQCTVFEHTFLITGVNGQHHAPAALPLGKKYGTHSTGGLVGPRFGLDECGKGKSSRSTTGVRIAKSANL
jgi:hypothetical protein